MMTMDERIVEKVERDALEEYWIEDSWDGTVQGETWMEQWDDFRRRTTASQA